MATNTNQARDSREWELPDYLEETDGGVVVRLDRVSVAKVLAPVVLPAIVLVVLSVMQQDLIWWVGGGAFAVVVLIASPVVALWWRRAAGVVPVNDVRLAARIELAGTVLLTVAAVATAVWAAVRDLTAGEMFSGSGLFHIVPFALVAPALAMSAVAGWLLRVARRVDPATPPARLPRDRSVRPLWYAVDYGEAGARFPNVLVVALGAPVGAAAWLSVVLANLAYDHDDTMTIVVMGSGIGLVPLVAGVAWWPWLRAALTRGLRPEQVRAVGWAHLVGGCAGALGAAGAIVAVVIDDGAGNALPGMLGVLMVGGFLALPGGQLIAFGAKLRRAGIHAVREVPVNE